MDKIEDLLIIFKNNSNNRFNSFEIEDSNVDLSKIQDVAYLENSKWIGGDEEFICLAIDLDSSSVLSARKSAGTMAKLYEYFTQNIVDILKIDDILANYIDIKGDGVFGIYQGSMAVERAIIAGITFRTFFEKVVKPKFKDDFAIDLRCKTAVYRDKILVKKIGSRKYNNEVWAGKLVNNTYKTMNVSHSIKESDIKLKDRSLLIVSEKIYTYLYDNYYNSAIMSCGCGSTDGNSEKLWNKFDVSKDEDIIGDKVYYLSSIWCDIHGDDYLSDILNNNN